MAVTSSEGNNPLRNPLLDRFKTMELLWSKLTEDELGGLILVEVRRDPRTGERQQCTTALDTDYQGL